MTKQHGFTLSETLAVLAIIAVIGSVSMLAVKHVSDRFIDERTIFQFELDVLAVQTAAQRQRSTKSIFLRQHEYVVNTSGRYIHRVFPTGTMLRSHNLGADLQYTEVGTVRRAGVIKYEGLSRQYSLTILPINGRVRIE